MATWKTVFLFHNVLQSLFKDLTTTPQFWNVFDKAIYNAGIQSMCTYLVFRAERVFITSTKERQNVAETFGLMVALYSIVRLTLRT